MDITLWLQIVSIFMGIIGVALPLLITVVAYVYVSRMNERMDDLEDQVNQLWNRVKENKRDTQAAPR